MARPGWIALLITLSIPSDMGVRSLLAGRVGLIAIAADLIVRFLGLIARNDREQGSRLARIWFCADGPWAGVVPTLSA
jgi:hypothetical protein